MRLLGGAGLSCAIGNPHNAEGVCAALQRSIPEDVSSPGDLEIIEPRLRYFLSQFCFQQSPGYSTSPQFDFLLRAIRDGFLNHDVSNLEPPSRLKDSI